MKKTVIISDYNKTIIKSLSELGFDVIPFSGCKDFNSFLKYHTDLFFAEICGRLFISESVINDILKINEYISDFETVKKITEGYPDEARLNCFEIGEYFVCSEKNVSEPVLNYALQNHKKVISVKQGYSKCACAVVGKNAVITEDSGLAEKLLSNNVEVLKISPGGVILHGFDYGFIGGSSFFDGDEETAFFFGDVSKHPEFEKIKSFCEKQKTDICILDKEIPLTDLGSAVILKKLLN